MPLNPNSFEAITLAIQATGQAGVAELTNNVNALKAAIASEQATLANGAPVTAQAIGDIANFTARLHDAEAALKAATAANEAFNANPADFNSAARAATKAGSAFQASGAAMRGATQATLELSRGFEDLTTGGFLGVLNNIPRLFGGIGQAAGFAGPQVAAFEATASILATTGYVVYQNWGKLKKLFDDGLGEKPAESIKSLKKEIDELNAKEGKTRIDYQDIDIATRKLKALTDAEAAYDRLKNKKSAAQQESEKRATEAIVEFGGGDDATSSVDKLIKTAQEVTPKEKSGKLQDLEKQLAKAENLARTGGTHDVIAANNTIASLKPKIATQTANDQEAFETRVKDMVTGAASGNQKQLASLLELIEKNPERFDSRGANSGKLAEGLGGAGLNVINSEKGIKQANKEFEVQQDRAEREAKARKEEKKADDDEEEFYRKTEMANEAIQNKARFKMDEDFKQDQERAGKKATHEAEQQAKQAATAQAREAAEVAPGFLPQAEATIAQNRLNRAGGAPVARNRRDVANFEASGQPYALPEAEMKAQVERGIASSLKASGQDPKLAGNIADTAFEKVGDQYAKNFAQTGNQVSSLIAVVESAQLALNAAQSGIVARDAKIAQLQSNAMQINQNAQRSASMQRRGQPQAPALIQYPLY